MARKTRTPSHAYGPLLPAPTPFVRAPAGVAANMRAAQLPTATAAKVRRRLAQHVHDITAWKGAAIAKKRAPLVGPPIV